MKLNNIIVEETIINRNIDWLFNFTQDFSQRIKWDKQTIEIEFLDGFTQLQKGAKVYTKSVEGIRMETEYLTFEPSSEISIQMLNKSSIFKSFIGTWNYIQLEKGKTILRITYQFNLCFPYNFISKIVFKKVKNNMINKLYFLKTYLDKLDEDG